MAKTTNLESVILFARAGFRGINDAAQVETIMNSVVEAIDGTDLMVDGEAVGTISDAQVVGSLIRGNVSGVDTAFLASEAGQNLCRRIAASFEAPATPKKSAAKPAKKTAKSEPEPESEEEEAEEPAEEPKPTKKSAPKPASKPTAKPAPGKGKPVVPMTKKIRVTL